MKLEWDVIIVGAGPAGMSCAMKCAEEGLEVLVLDKQAQAGGQIWKNAGTADDKLIKFLGKEYSQGAKIVQKFLKSNVTFMTNALVWAVDKTTVCASMKGESYRFSAKYLVLASGALERPAPVNGWDLPCVMGAGAYDLLLKSSGLTPNAPVVVCGNGPLILQTLAHLCQLKVPVSGLVLTGKIKQSAWEAFLNSLKILGRPLYFLHGMSYSLQVLLKKVPTFFDAEDVRITEENDASSARVSFRAGGKDHSLEAKTVLVHEGIIASSRITLLAGCRHAWDAHNRYWYAECNAWGESNIDNLYIAGDSGLVSGAEAALAKGALVGIGICAKSGKYDQKTRDAKAKKYKKTILRCRWMQDFTDALFTPNLQSLMPADDTIVCRCEEVTAKEIKDIVLSGCRTTGAVKIQCRAGMGICQGRMCSSSIANIISEVHGIPIESMNSFFHARTPLFPVKMGELANLSAPKA